MRAVSLYKETDIRPCFDSKLQSIEQDGTDFQLSCNKQTTIAPFNMNFYITIVTMLASLAVATPANPGNLEARVDCSTCGCSSAESCTVSTPWTVNIKSMRHILKLRNSLT